MPVERGRRFVAVVCIEVFCRCFWGADPADPDDPGGQRSADADLALRACPCVCVTFLLPKKTKAPAKVRAPIARSFLEDLEPGFEGRRKGKQNRKRPRGPSRTQQADEAEGKPFVLAWCWWCCWWGVRDTEREKRNSPKRSAGNGCGARGAGAGAIARATPAGSHGILASFVCVPVSPRFFFCWAHRGCPGPKTSIASFFWRWGA